MRSLILQERPRDRKARVDVVLPTGIDAFIRGYERNDGKVVVVSEAIVDRSRARAKGKLRADVSDYQIDNSKLTTHCAPLCKTCRRGGKASPRSD